MRVVACLFFRPPLTPHATIMECFWLFWGVSGLGDQGVGDEELSASGNSRSSSAANTSQQEETGGETGNRSQQEETAGETGNRSQQEETMKSKSITIDEQ